MGEDYDPRRYFVSVTFSLHTLFLLHLAFRALHCLPFTGKKLIAVAGGIAQQLRALAASKGPTFNSH